MARLTTDVEDTFIRKYHSLQQEIRIVQAMGDGRSLREFSSVGHRPYSLISMGETKDPQRLESTEIYNCVAISRSLVKVCIRIVTKWTGNICECTKL